MKALLLIDPQNGFCPGGALAVDEGDTIMPLLNRLMAEGGFDVVVATQDWHPADHKSFAANHPGENVYEMIDLNGIKQILWPAHCVQGTEGAQFHKDLDLSLIDHVVQKGTNPEIDSYSGFVENDGKTKTGLQALLEKLAAERGEKPENIEVVVCGLALDYCVGFTAIDAAQLGYKVTVALDATRAVNLNPGDDVAMIRKLVELKERGLAPVNVEVVTTQQLIPAPRRDIEIISERSRQQGMQP